MMHYIVKKTKSKWKTFLQILLFIGILDLKKNKTFLRNRDEWILHFLHLYLFSQLNYLYSYARSEWAPIKQRLFI